jgi:hypothetical protein
MLGPHRRSAHPLVRHVRAETCDRVIAFVVAFCIVMLVGGPTTRR